MSDIKCPKCKSENVSEEVYIGGEHDPSYSCDDCGAHIGCWKCDSREDGG